MSRLTRGVTQGVSSAASDVSSSQVLTTAIHLMVSGKPVLELAIVFYVALQVLV